MVRKRQTKTPAKVGKWNVGRVIECGGNGCVSLACEDSCNTLRAIKVPHRNIWTSRTLYKRFEAEVRAYQLCQDLRVLQLIDASIPKEPNECDRPYLVLELGIPLAKHLLKKGISECVVALHQLASTLAEMHAREIFHRDIKPDNLFYTERTGSAAVGDLGLVKMPESDTLTRATERLGAFYFMAPEMFGNTDGVDFSKADVYSLAKTLWVLASQNRNPLPGHMVIEVEALRISSWDRSLQSLDVLMMNSTDPVPENRPTMNEFADELEAWLNPYEAPNSDDVLNLSHLAAANKPINEFHVAGERRAAEARQRSSKLYDEVVQRFRDWGLLDSKRDL